MVVQAGQPVGGRQLGQASIRLFQCPRPLPHSRIDILLHRLQLLLLFAQRVEQRLTGPNQPLLAKNRLDAQGQLRLVNRPQQTVTHAGMAHRERQQLVLRRLQQQQLARMRYELMQLNQRLQSTLLQELPTEQQHCHRLVTPRQLIEPLPKHGGGGHALDDTALTEASQELLPKSQQFPLLVV